MQKIELQIIALANSESHPGNFAIILEESEGNRRLPIIIGGFEAQAIAVALERMQPNRPLTHDLFKNVMVELGTEVEEIIISKLQEGVFYATLICKQANGEVLEVDSRTSDAIALAVRFGCPIFTVEDVLSVAGVKVEKAEEEQESKGSKKKAKNLEQQSIEELKELLNKSLANEDYERAAKIRDLIKQRENDQSRN